MGAVAEHQRESIEDTGRCGADGQQFGSEVATAKRSRGDGRVRQFGFAGQL